jgi:hypothetical protein
MAAIPRQSAGQGAGAGARLALAVIGDSDSHSYQDRNHFAPGNGERGGPWRAVTLCWGEVLARLRGDEIDLGDWGLHGNHWRVARLLERMGLPARSPYKEDHRYNFAMTGNCCVELMGGRHRQVPRLLALMAREPSRWREGVVVIRIGVNDIGTPDALDDLARNGRDAATHARVCACVDDVRRAVAEIRGARPSMRVVLVGMFDNSNCARHFGRWCDARMLANIRAGLDGFDAPLRALADADPQIAFFDDRAWFAARWGGRAADGRPDYHALVLADDLMVTNTVGDHPRHAVLRDGHAGLAMNAEWARSLVDLLNARFGCGLAPITRAETAVLVRAATAAALTGPGEHAAAASPGFG